MTHDVLQEAVRALREQTGETPATPDATRARILASLRKQRARRLTLIKTVLPLAAVVVGSLAWAAPSRLPALWSAMTSLLDDTAHNTAHDAPAHDTTHDAPASPSSTPPVSSAAPAAGAGATTHDAQDTDHVPAAEPPTQAPAGSPSDPHVDAPAESPSALSVAAPSAARLAPSAPRDALREPLATPDIPPRLSAPSSTAATASSPAAPAASVASLAPAASAASTAPSASSGTTPEGTSAAAPPTPQPDPVSKEHALYKEAHRLHFVARNAGAALVAWDAYLRADPRGRFATEARYNRALCLVRLGRATEARSALAPFARGAFGGYRQAEAQALLDAMDRAANPAP